MLYVTTEYFEPGEYTLDESFFMHVDGTRVTWNPANADPAYGPCGTVIGVTAGGSLQILPDESNGLFTQMMSKIGAKIVR